MLGITLLIDTSGPPPLTGGAARSVYDYVMF